MNWTSFVQQEVSFNGCTNSPDSKYMYIYSLVWNMYGVL